MFLFFGILVLAIFLRLFGLTDVPPALHGDELGVGYNAFTLLKTGRDEYGRFLPLTFRSDFTPLIFYATMPFIGLLGLTEYATRLPTALVGILTVPASFFFVLELTRRKKLAFLVMFLIALSSWHIRTSRIALELTWALFFQLAGVSFFLRGLKHGKRYIFMSFLIFGISIFSYHSTKMTTPLLIIGLFFIYAQKIKRVMHYKIFLLFFCFFILFPIALYLKVQAFSQIRFVGISVFTLWKNSYPENTNLFSMRPVFDLSSMIVKNYFVHFHPRLLFWDNTNLRYFQLPKLGLFYLWQAPFILTGLIDLVMQIKKEGEPWVKLVFFWLILAPLPAAFTTGVPYANIGRVLLLLPILELITACGIFILVRNKTIKPLALLCSFLGVAFFLRQYFVITPSLTESFWGTQWRTAAKNAVSKEHEVNRIIMTNPTHQSYMYILFYGKKNPQWLYAVNRTLSPVIGYSRIDKYEFRPVQWTQDSHLTNTLLIISEAEIPQEAITLTQQTNTSNIIILNK